MRVFVRLRRRRERLDGRVDAQRAFLELAACKTLASKRRVQRRVQQVRVRVAPMALYSSKDPSTG